jgi:hypothetical protein
MRALIVAGILTSLMIGPWQAVAEADGGALRLLERHGAYQISVFTAPTPLRAGPVDISVLVQDVSTGQPLTDARVAMRITSLGHLAPTIDAHATSNAATNKLMHAALIELAEPGRWSVTVNCDGPGGHAQVHFEMDAGPRLPRWLSAWPWFSWPLVVVLIFATARWRTRWIARRPDDRGNQSNSRSGHA